MAATAEASIAEALLERLRTLPGTPALPVSWPNVAFRPPPAAGTYLEARLLPNDNRNYGIGAEGPTQHVGILQVTVVHPSNSGGTLGPLDIAGGIVSHFAKGTRLWAGAVAVKVYEQPRLAPSIQDGERVRVPVSIRYSASI